MDKMENEIKKYKFNINSFWEKCKNINNNYIFIFNMSILLLFYLDNFSTI